MRPAFILALIPLALSLGLLANAHAHTFDSREYVDELSVREDHFGDALAAREILSEISTLPASSSSTTPPAVQSHHATTAPTCGTTPPYHCCQAMWFNPTTPMLTPPCGTRPGHHGLPCLAVKFHHTIIRDALPCGPMHFAVQSIHTTGHFALRSNPTTPPSTSPAVESHHTTAKAALRFDLTVGGGAGEWSSLLGPGMSLVSCRAGSGSRFSAAGDIR
ncbi:hypothetical protein DFP72DRAFT_1162483 [Ephemerocybe angulata]|uniref:Uncharacterized protein n=1 Tax=Ephemerocybe angulata TaxID=980116 RepID=A0A8H6MH23_9AGAR|nr:hypothetical protein DFP72DRAFT_1162483 [Tulosesus angulatus]